MAFRLHHARRPSITLLENAMLTEIRPTATAEVPVASPTLPAKRTPESHDAFENWEYSLFCFMVVCMMVLWSMMFLDFFGSGFWVVFNCSP
jgi:hypothetical protein